MSRRSRLVAALLAIFALAFAQLALASYACPSVADLVEMAQMQHDNQDDGGLCEHHCKSGGRVSFEIAKPSFTPSPAIAAAPMLRIETPAPASRDISVCRARLSIAGPEPPFDRLPVLRI